MTLNILIADDSATNRSLFTLTAARMGHHADAAASGREATDFFNTHEYDLVFIDLHMPQMDGFALAATLTAQNTRRTPLYAMSGFIDGESEKRLLAAGFYGWFIKPLDREKILRAAVEAGITEKSAAEPENAADIPAKLLAVYARELRARAAACEQHWQSGDLAALHREAHTLRALANMLKTSDVATAAAAIENLRAGAEPEMHIPAAAAQRLQALCVACHRTAALIERSTPPNPAS